MVSEVTSLYFLLFPDVKLDWNNKCYIIFYIWYPRWLVYTSYYSLMLSLTGTTDATKFFIYGPRGD